MSGTQVYNVTMNEQGRVVIPADVRRQLDIRPGERLVLRVRDGRMILIKPRPLRGAFKHLAPGRSLTDELIAERRAEFGREMRE